MAATCFVSDTAAGYEPKHNNNLLADNPNNYLKQLWRFSNDVAPVTRASVRFKSKSPIEIWVV